MSPFHSSPQKCIVLTTVSGIWHEARSAGGHPDDLRILESLAKQQVHSRGPAAGPLHLCELCGIVRQIQESLLGKGYQHCAANLLVSYPQVVFALHSL